MSAASHTTHQRLKALGSESRRSLPTGLKSRRRRAGSFRRLPSLFLPLLQRLEAPHSLARGHITPTSASVITAPPGTARPALTGPCVFLTPPPRQSRVIPSSQEPDLNHICKGPFSTEGHIATGSRDYEVLDGSGSGYTAATRGHPTTSSCNPHPPSQGDLVLPANRSAAVTHLKCTCHSAMSAPKMVATETCALGRGGWKQSLQPHS